MFGRFDAERVADFGHGCALFGDRSRKFLRCAGIDDLSGRGETRRDCRVRNDFADIGGDPFTGGRRKPGRREYAGETIKCQRFEAGFLRSRNIRQACCALRIGECEHLDLAGHDMRPLDGVGAHISVNPAFREIVDGLHRVLVRHLRHVQLFGFQKGREQEVVGARH
ncbi:MAG TPA: hypothetical protein VFP43_10740 [Mesorhizobium sp.]|nr:hypothetical protein [Mesorhizobium sp.]